MIKLIGVLLILIGFTLKLDTIAVVLLAGVATGLVSSMDFMEILNVLGSAFVSTRYMTLLLLTLATVVYQREMDLEKEQQNVFLN